MKKYYVYMVRCADEYIYVGITNNLERRIIEHKRGLNKSCFTFRRRPLELIFYQDFNDIGQAISFEKKIKKWSRTKKQALADGNFDLLEIYSECRNATHYKYKPKS